MQPELCKAAVDDVPDACTVGESSEPQCNHTVLSARRRQVLQQVLYDAVVERGTLWLADVRHDNPASLRFRATGRNVGTCKRG